MNGAPEITAATVNCSMGCRTEGVKFAYCSEYCEIRKCVYAKGFETCGVFEKELDGCRIVECGFAACSRRKGESFIRTVCIKIPRYVNCKQVWLWTKIKIILSGGGTGGHIYPAVAVAEALQRRLGDGVELLFVGAEGKMEMEKIPALGYRIEGLPVAGLQRRLTARNLSLPFKVAASLRKARRVIRSSGPT